MASLLNGSEPGGKLDGLRQVPSSWVPAFFVISSELHRRWLERPIDSKSESLSLLDPSEREQIEDELRGLGGRPESILLIVRSNARGEGLEQRGLLKSYKSDGTAEGILA